MIHSYMQACVFDASKVQVSVKNGYLDVKVIDGDVQLLLCLNLPIVDNIVSRMESALMDAQCAAHPETVQGEAEVNEDERWTLADASEAACMDALPPIDVIDVEKTLSPAALREALLGK